MLKSGCTNRECTPAMKLKNPLPRKPLGLEEQETDTRVSLTWQEATDYDGGPVSGYNLYRCTEPLGAYRSVNATPITAKQYHDIPDGSRTTYY